ncbi:esterase-like activity of phytase family protein [Tumidithrix helvetica PCC 7403]|uniref:esterase-like activity of phytase family protein n=1 Tax=Tumidithrix helvetica TaxID=3457545 RepID=UPI003C8B5431
MNKRLPDLRNIVYRTSFHRISWFLALVICLVIIFLDVTHLSIAEAKDRTFVPLSLEFINAYELPKQEFERTPVGGLSGITYDRDLNLFYAISDDRSEKAPARFYTLKLDFDSDKQAPKLEKVEVKAVTFLKDWQGKTYAQGGVDPEGIALTSQQSVFISSEGVTHAGIPPFIDEFDLKTGAWKQSVPIPARYRLAPKGEIEQGVQDNFGFEALALIGSAPGDPYRLFTATESALTQDKQPSTQGARSRFLHYVLGSGSPMVIAEHLYPVEVSPTAGIIGITELLPIDRGGHFLSLERAYGAKGFGIKIWQFATGSASDTSKLPSLQGNLGSLRPIRKKLVLDLERLGIRLDNSEGMALGPHLSDGTQSLIVVSDDNFSNTQINQFLLFRLKLNS